MVSYVRTGMCLCTLGMMCMVWYHTGTPGMSERSTYDTVPDASMTSLALLS